jgi:hypothetical protein
VFDYVAQDGSLSTSPIGIGASVTTGASGGPHRSRSSSSAISAVGVGIGSAEPREGRGAGDSAFTRTHKRGASASQRKSRSRQSGGCAVESRATDANRNARPTGTRAGVAGLVRLRQPGRAAWESTWWLLRVPSGHVPWGPPRSQSWRCTSGRRRRDDGSVHAIGAVPLDLRDLCPRRWLSHTPLQTEVHQSVVGHHHQDHARPVCWDSGLDRG